MQPATGRTSPQDGMVAVQIRVPREVVAALDEAVERARVALAANGADIRLSPRLARRSIGRSTIVQMWLLEKLAERAPLHDEAA